MKVKSSLCVFASLLVTFTATTEAGGLAGSWPPLDKPPPILKEFTDLVDTSKVANAPLVKTPGANCPTKDDFCNWSCTGCTRNDSDIVKCPTKGDWGITFDDGPSPFTPGLLDFLGKTNTKVTFFVVGSRVVENPEILQRAVKEGHQIGIHTWSHPALTTQSTEQIISELQWTAKAIKAAVNLTPKHMRPPFGDYDDRVRNIATQLGYKVVIWDLDTNDWMSADDPNFQLTWIEGNFTQWVKQPSTTGHISLEHDIYNQTAARAQLGIPIVQKAGFSIKPVAQCVGEQAYVENVPVGASSSSSPAAASASPSAAASPAAASPASGGSGYGGSGKYLAEGSASPSASASAPSGSSTPNSASLNNNNLSLLSGLLLIVGTLMYI